jgi:hypothetical protein
MDLSASVYIDSREAKIIIKLFRDLLELDIPFHIAEAHSEVLDMLKKEEAEDLFSHISRKDSLHDVVTTCLHDHLKWEKELIKLQDLGK